MTTGAYSFLPWLRTGLTTRITGDPGIERATIPVRLQLTGDALQAGAPAPSRLVEQPVQLYGPGDVIGVDQRAISRTEPRPFISNFEPNFLAHIEFYDEGFPWRYSPAKPDASTKRLEPWLALVVLADGSQGGDPEFADGVLAGGPLPFVTVKNPAALQPPGELGAWAHVHVNGELTVPLAIDDPNDMTTALTNLDGVLRTAPDSACSRLICPRHLRPSTTYHAFLVPAFETGRRAGLGIDPGGVPATQPSWGVAGMPASGQLPYYHRWSFTTSTSGDFEFLVRLLKPIRSAEPVGTRDVDAHRSPGFGLPGVTTPTEPGGVLRLGGALRLPDSDEHIDEHENWDNYYELHAPPAAQYPNQWQRAMAGLVNLADGYQRDTAAAANTGLSTQIPSLAGQVDPVITPPLYGRWHALTPQLLVDLHGQAVPEQELRNWVHRLNLDPRFRVAAHYGTQVVQGRQEELMAAAWSQLGDVLRANSRIRAAQLAREVGNALHGKHIEPPPAQPGFAADDPLPSGRALTVTAPAHARVVERTSTSLRFGLSEVEEQLAVGFKVAVSRVATAPVSAVMRRVVRPGARLMKALEFPADKPAETLVARIDELQVTAAPPKGTPAAVVTPADVDAVLPPKPDGDPVDTLALNPGFVLRDYGDPTTTPVGDHDSDEATNFKGALRELYGGLAAAQAGGEVPERLKLDVTAATADMLTGLRSDKTVTATVLDSVDLPDRLRPAGDELTEVMAYPVFDMPMYSDLLTMSVDTFVPGLGELPPNSITLLENNRRFIESYLVGLNHEMGRELLWREFPTDQRGTPFRQFWDPRPALPEPGETAQARRERLYDIPPIHTWARTALLGENDNGAHKDDLVLVIRGELLKKYPTAAIYAHKAAWPVVGGIPVTTGERELADLPPDQPTPPPELVRLPIYEAKVDPDITLLGFDLDADEARGRGGDLGWFFVLKERPGDPRFGLDEALPGAAAPVEVWNDLTWQAVDPADRHRFIQFDTDVHVTLDPFDHDEDDLGKTEQRADDVQVKAWQSDISSADVAYILFQAPVLIAVHAGEMLPDA